MSETATSACRLSLIGKQSNCNWIYVKTGKLNRTWTRSNQLLRPHSIATALCAWYFTEPFIVWPQKYFVFVNRRSKWKYNSMQLRQFKPTSSHTEFSSFLAVSYVCLLPNKTLIIFAVELFALGTLTKTKLVFSRSPLM